MIINLTPKSPEPTAVGVFSSAFAVDIVSPAWISPALGCATF